MSNTTPSILINTNSRYVLRSSDSDGSLTTDDRITIRNKINDVNPIRLTQLVDVNANSISDNAVLVYNANSDYFETKVITNFNTIEISNSVTINTLNANGSIGTPGQVLVSNGSSIYWANQVSIPDNMDGGFY